MTEQKARGVGRPSKQAHEKRSIILATRLTPAESEAVDRLVELEAREADRFGFELDASAVLRVAIRERVHSRGLPWPGDEPTPAPTVTATIIDGSGVHPMAPAKPAADPRQIAIPGTEGAKPRKVKASIPDVPDRDVVRRQIEAARAAGKSIEAIASGCGLKRSGVSTFATGGAMGNDKIRTLADHLAREGFAYEP